MNGSRRQLIALLAVCGLVATTAACERKSGGGAAATGDILVGFYGSLTGDGASFGSCA